MDRRPAVRWIPLESDGFHWTPVEATRRVVVARSSCTRSEPRPRLHRGPMHNLHNPEPCDLSYLLESAEAAAYRVRPHHARWLVPLIRMLATLNAHLAQRLMLANR
jgi:hypothetical protein